MARSDSGSELSELSSSLFTSLDVCISNRPSESASTAPLPMRTQLSRPNLVAIPPLNTGRSNRALHQIEALLETIVDAVSNGEVLEIPLQTTRVRSGNQGEDGRTVVRFPGRNVQEAARFGALLRIVELSHEALLSGNIITKRNLYYQNVDLFKSQTVVDEMIDNLAFTFGVGRDDLNIVAADKGLIAGPIDLFVRGGGVVRCGLPSRSSTLLPSIRSVEKVDFGEARWLLVIEKEATFRTLAAAQYGHTSSAGPGILVTAKGYPDLATRQFLHTIHSVRPELQFFALVDFDPPGIAILRNYKHGSKRLEHEQNSTVSGLRWLGIRSHDILSRATGSEIQTPSGQLNEDESQSTQGTSSQDSTSFSQSSSQGEVSRTRRRIPRTASTRSLQKISSLSQTDRKKAVDIMNDICNAANPDDDDREQLEELQRMLMMNAKAEMQAVDDCGDITEWLDEKLEASISFGMN